MLRFWLPIEFGEWQPDSETIRANILRDAKNCIWHSRAYRPVSYTHLTLPTTPYV